MRNFLLSLLLIPALWLGFSRATPPQYGAQFGDKLLSTNTGSTSTAQDESFFSFGVNRDLTLKQNVQCLFYPSVVPPPFCNKDTVASGGYLRTYVRYIGFGIMLLYLVRAAAQIVMFPDDDGKRKTAISSILYIFYGAFLLFAVTWILGTALNIEHITGGTDQLVSNLSNGVFFQLLLFLKVAVFFLAIVMIIYYGARLMQASDQEAQIKNAKAGAINVVTALVVAKSIDYIYYIAQKPDFQTTATSFILQISTILGRLLGVSFVLSLFYTGFLMITSAGDEAALKRAKGIVSGIFFASMTIFLFLLITYQVFTHFGG